MSVTVPVQSSDGAVSSDRSPLDASRHLATGGNELGRLGRLAGAGAALAVLVAVWAFASEFWIDIANLAFIAAIAALGLDLILGHAGLVSVGNAAFLGIGALTVALLNQSSDFPVIPSILLGGVVCAVVGLVVSLPSSRITGLYLAIATLAFHFIALWAIREIQTDRVGDSGFVVPPARVFGVELFELRTWYVFLAASLIIVLLLQRAILLSKPGRALHAIRERPALAVMSGIAIRRYKAWAFAASSFLVGVAGGLTAYYIGNVSYANFTLHLAIHYLAIVIVGGLGTIYGPVVGAVFITALPHFVRDLREALGLTSVIDNTEVFLLEGSVVGIVVVAVIVFQPKGLSVVGNLARSAAGRLVRGGRA